MKHFSTKAVHAGAARDVLGAISPPLYLATNYEHLPTGAMLNGFVYTSIDNPVQQRLENALAVLEGGKNAIVYGSGTAAGVAVLQALPRGSHVLFPDDLFYGYPPLIDEFLPRWGIEASYVDMSNLATLEGAMRANTSAIFAETPSNPLMKITDIRSAAEIAHDRGAILVVDSTFATPVLTRPLELGADVVLQSTTKYLGGHSDTQSGALIFKDDGDLYDLVLHNRKIYGSIASPFSSWLILRGLRTLELRLKAHSDSALKVARALGENPRVLQVNYPGLVTHNGHEIAVRQMSPGFGGMLSVRVKGGAHAAVRVASSVGLFVNAGSFGGPESLIRHTHSTSPQPGVPEDLLRIFVGLEHADDLIADLETALA